MAKAEGWWRGRLGVALATGFIAGLLIALAGQWAAARFDALLIETVRADAERNRRSLLAEVDRFRVVAVVDAIDRRIVGFPDQGRPGVYLVIAPDGTRVTGNLPRWPEGLQREAGWHLVTLGAGPLAGRALVHVEQLPGGWWLAIGRSIAAWDRFRVQVMWLGAGVAGLAFLFALGIALAAGRRAAREVAAMNAGLAAFRAGDLGRRLGRGQGEPGLRLLAAGVDQTMDHTERLVRGMQRLSATVAHELKSPLARAAKRLADGDGGAAETELRDTLALVDALLDIAANETATNAGARPCDLGAVARDVAALFRPVAEARGIALRLEAAPAPALADPDLIARALSNLLDNGIRHATATVTLLSGTADGQPFLAVADDGTGPPASDIAALIARAQPGPRADGSRSSGLGLRLVQAIALRHGGALTVDPLSPGLRIGLTLPTPSM